MALHSSSTLTLFLRAREYRVSPAPTCTDFAPVAGLAAAGLAACAAGLAAGSGLAAAAGFAVEGVLAAIGVVFAAGWVLESCAEALGSGAAAVVAGTLSLRPALRVSPG